MTSLRRRLTLWLLGGLVVAFGLAALLLHAVVTDALAAQFDLGLSAKAAALGTMLELDGPYLEFDFAAEIMPEFQGGPEAEYYSLWFADASRIQSSASLDGEWLPRRCGPVDAPEFWDLALPDGRAGRAIGVAVPVGGREGESELSPEELPRITIVLARSRAELDATLAALATGLLVAGAAALALGAWAVAFGVRRGLLPIGSLTAEVEGIDATSLSRRVDGTQAPVELSPLVTKLNELLARLEASFNRQRRMTAAMAHELRTPIAELRTASDIARRWPDDETLADEAVSTAHDVAQRMSRSIEAVMRYCRLEAGQAVAESGPIALRALLDELWRPHDRHAAERGVSFVNAVPDEAVVESDRELLLVALGNLLHNAACFASPGTVRAAAERRGETWTLRLENETDQLDPQDLDRLAEPFWRKDSARTDDQHSGLGLTLVASVAQALGAKVAFTLESGRFAASIGLPLSRERPEKEPLRPLPAHRVTSG